MPPSPPEPLYIMRADMTEIHCVLFHITTIEETLYAGTNDGTVHIWDLKINKIKKIFKSSDNACLSIHVTNDYLITQDKSCSIKVWEMVSNNFTRVYTKEFNNFSFCKVDSFKDDAFYFAVPQPQSVVGVCVFKSPEILVINSLKHSDESAKLGEVMQLKIFRYDIKLYLAVVYENGMLIVWDFFGASVIYSDQLINDTPMSFDFDSASLQGVCGSNEKTIIVFKLDDNMRITKRKIIEITNAGTGSLRIRPDRKIVAAGCWDGRVRIFSWKTCKLLAVLDFHRASVLDVRFSENVVKSWNSKHLLAAAATDKRISLWNIYE